jgi:hypothetical protein
VPVIARKASAMTTGENEIERIYLSCNDRIGGDVVNAEDVNEEHTLIRKDWRLCN